jgi:hypothetical protein
MTMEPSRMAVAISGLDGNIATNNIIGIMKRILLKVKS